MVAILINAEIRTILNESTTDPKVQTTGKTSTISHKSLSAALKSLPNPPKLHNLLSRCELHFSHSDAVAHHTPHQRDPALEKRVARLKARLQDAQYASIVRDVSRAAASSAEVEDARMAKFAPQMSLAANVVITMATCFAAGYFVVKNTSGSDTKALIGGVAGLIIALVVESVLLLSKMYTIDDAVQRTARRRQRLAQKQSKSS